MGHGIEQLKQYEIPKAYITDTDTHIILRALMDDFDFEEKQALYYYVNIDSSIEEIAQISGLSCTHVVSILNLYRERLEYKLDFLKKVKPHEADEMLPLCILLYPDGQELLK